MHFDWTVNFGNVLTIAAILGGAYRFVKKFADTQADQQKRLDLHERWIAAHAECNKTQVSILAEVREDLAYLRGARDAREHARGPHLKDKY